MKVSSCNQVSKCSLNLFPLTGHNGKLHFLAFLAVRPGPRARFKLMAYGLKLCIKILDQTIKPEPIYSFPFHGNLKNHIFKMRAL